MINNDGDDDLKCVLNLLFILTIQFFECCFDVHKFTIQIKQMIIFFKKEQEKKTIENNSPKF